MRLSRSSVDVAPSVLQLACDCDVHSSSAAPSTMLQLLVSTAVDIAASSSSMHFDISHLRPSSSLLTTMTRSQRAVNRSIGCV